MDKYINFIVVFLYWVGGNVVRSGEFYGKRDLNKRHIS